MRQSGLSTKLPQANFGNLEGDRMNLVFDSIYRGLFNQWTRAVLAVMMVVLGFESACLAQATQKATFAGGCFWCMEPPFEKLSGVIAVVSGYTGGSQENPTYEQVSAGETGHAEAIQIEFNPEKISYAQLLEVFWRNIDPTTANRQFCDSGSQYRSGVFFHDKDQEQLARESLRKISESQQLKSPVVTEVQEFKKFYPAEEYHQDFYKKQPDHYYRYRAGCGRDRRLNEIWGASPGK